MGSSLTFSNGPNIALRYAVFGGQSFYCAPSLELRFRRQCGVLFSYCPYLLLTKLGHVLGLFWRIWNGSFCAMPYRILPVLASSAVAKIFKAIVSSCPVNVSTFLTLRARAHKSLQNKNMRRNLPPSSVPVKNYLKITRGALTRLQNFKDIFGQALFAKNSSHATLATHLVAFPVWYGFVNFSHLRILYFSWGGVNDQGLY